MARFEENPTPASDSTVGKNVTYLRGSRPQAEIAEGMKKKGFKWTQTTVWEIEKGKRTLKFLEAIALADILETQTSYLEHVPDDYFMQRNVLKTMEDLGKASSDLLDAFMVFNMARGKLGAWVQSMRADRHDDGDQADPDAAKGEAKYQRIVDRTLLETLQETAKQRGKSAELYLQAIEGEISNEWLLRHGPRGNESPDDPNATDYKK